MEGIGLILAILLGAALLYILPIIVIISSNKTTGTEKLLWVLAVLFISWFAWIIYALVAPVVRR
ncbi:MAG TPA: hypothetical protein VKY29_06375 [Cryomorphaceae bacterium]|nr:hypothetical protein [Cryomorphaceae bacterium]